MVVCSIKSENKVVHSCDCPYARAIHKDHKKYFKSYAIALDKGFRLCDHCSPVVEKIRENRGEIDRFCDLHELKVTHKEGIMLVSSRYDDWKIIMNGYFNGLFLYHKNKENKEDDGKYAHFIPGYHSQKCQCKTIFDFLNYIAGHDEYRDAKTAIDQLDGFSNDSESGLYIPISYIQKYSIPAQLEQGYQKIKGTKRYRKKIAKEKRRKRNASIKRVYDLFDELEKERIQAVCDQT